MTSIYFTFWAFPNSEDDSIIHLTAGFAVSLRGIISSSFRVLTIFFWAQTIKTIKNKKKFKCIIIHYNPYIKWEDNHPENKTDEGDTQNDKIDQSMNNYTTRTSNGHRSVEVPVSIITKNKSNEKEKETEGNQVTYTQSVPLKSAPDVNDGNEHGYNDIETIDLDPTKRSNTADKKGKSKGMHIEMTSLDLMIDDMNDVLQNSDNLMEIQASTPL
eukprot:CAMPEP_0201579720 /NCGR_PEP_ID=MMETSP0190_2-20130828/27490_1 /ASSEMBLY_ACC=CAM_ASM_000263 /TAXON_ID=37353 /ORGANISM="Rosalina sp." /LENGTH=214 /DNA_ID=CAMNT_0048014545 /DNA_START=811 /DNA_END=1455 /DNA_ORIENTATION=+